MGRPQPPPDTPSDSDTDLPPPYEQAIASSSSHPPPPQQQPRPQEDQQDEQGTSPHHSIFTSNRETSRVLLSAPLTTSPSSLESLLTTQSSIPPRPILSVRGVHTESTSDSNGKNNKTETIVDFDFRVDITEYLLGAGAGEDERWRELCVVRDGDGQKVFRGGRWRSRRRRGECKGRCRRRCQRRGMMQALDEEENVGLVAGGEGGGEGEATGPGLRGWCERFCGDRARVKSFTFNRTITGFDANALRSSLTSHLRALNYRGDIQISTAIANRTLTIYSPHRVNQLRNNSLVFYLCIIFQLWVITWPIIWLMERRYEVVKSAWRFSRQEGANKQFAGGRDEATVAEELAPVVTQAAWERRSGGSVLTKQEMDLLWRLEREGRERGGRVVVVNRGQMGVWGTDS